MDLMTTTERSMRANRRRNRAVSLTAEIMKVLEPFIRLDEDRNRQEVYDRLFGLLSQDGIEILTDHDRAKIGLPPRDEEGWTDEELRVLDALRVQQMLKSFQMPIQPSPSQG